MEREHISIQMVLFMLVLGKIIKYMDKEFVNSVMVMNIMVAGRTIRWMVKVGLQRQMEIFMMDNGKRASVMDREHNIQRKKHMMVNGRMTLNMVLAKLHT